MKVLDLPDRGLTALLVLALQHGAVVEEHHVQQVGQQGGLLHWRPGATLLPADNPAATMGMETLGSPLNHDDATMFVATAAAAAASRRGPRRRTWRARQPSWAVVCFSACSDLIVVLSI